MTMHCPTRSLKNRGPGRLVGVAHHASCGSIGTLRAADVRRYGESSRAPSVIGKLVCHVKTSPLRTTLSRGMLAILGPGDNAVELPRPGQTGPLPRRKAPGIPSKCQLV